MTTEELLLKIVLDNKGFEQWKLELKKAEKESEASNKRELENLKSTNRQKYEATKQVNNELKSLFQQEIIEKKTASQKELLDYKETLRQKVQAEKQANAEIKAQNKLNTSSGVLQSQPLNPNSIGGLQQQKKYYKDYLSTLASGTPVFNQTQQHLAGINQKLKDLQAPAQKASFDFHHFIGTIRDLTIAGFALIHAFEFIKEAVIKAADFEDINKRFVELAGSEEEATKQRILLTQASGGRLNKEELEITSNKLRSFNITAEQTAQFLDLIHTKAKSAGIGFEAGSAGIQAFVNTGSKRGLKILLIDANNLQVEVDRLTEATGKYGDSLTDLEKEQIRINALINTNGRSVDEINSKVLTASDRIHGYTASWENLIEFIGGIFLPTVEAIGESFADVSRWMEHTIGEGNTLKTVLGEIVKYGNPIGLMVLWVQKLDESFRQATFGVYGMVDALKMVLAITGRGNFFGKTDAGNSGEDFIGGQTKKAVDLISSIPKPKPYRNQKAVQDELATAELTKKTAKNKQDEAIADEKIKALKKEDAEFNKNESIKVAKTKKAKEEELLTLDKVLSNIKEQIEATDKLYTANKLTESERDAQYKDALNILTTNEKLVTVTKKNISEEQKALEIKSNRLKYDEKIAEINNKLGDYLSKQTKELIFQRSLRVILGAPQSGKNYDIQTNTFKDKSLINDRSTSNIKTSELTTEQLTKEEARLKELQAVWESFWDKQKAQKDSMDLVANSINNLSGSIGSFFEQLASGNPDSFKSFMKSVVNSFITSVQAMILASAAAASGKAVLSFGLSLIQDLPLIAAAYLSLEAAKGIVQGLDDGGVVNGKSGVDTNPAMLTAGEYVIRKSVVNKMGKGFFDMLNGGSAVNTLGHYANGGMVNSGAMQIEIIGSAKIVGRGSDLRAVISKENFRLKRARSSRG